MFPTYRLLINVLAVVCLLLPQTARAGDGQTKDLWEAGRLCLVNEDFAGAEKNARKLALDSDPAQAIGGHIILAQIYIARSDGEQALRHLRMAELCQREQVSDSVLCSLYNGLGLYSINMENDSYSALNNYIKGYETALRCGHEEMQSHLLSNIVGIYVLLKDSTGVEYADENMEIARRVNNPRNLLFASYYAAQMYLTVDDTTKAISAGRTMMGIAEKTLPQFKALAYNLGGVIYQRMRDYAQSSDFYSKSIQSLTKPDRILKTRNYMGLAENEMRQGRNDKALSYIGMAESLNNGDINITTLSIVRLKSECLQQMGSYKAAIEVRRAYEKARDSLMTREKEQELRLIRTRFDLERKDNELNRRSIIILEKQRLIYLLSGLALTAIVATALLWLMYRKKQRLYRTIVRQNTNAIATEQALRESISCLQRENECLRAGGGESGDSKERKYSKSSLTDEMQQEIIDRIERLLHSEHVYKAQDFTKEVLARMVGCNSTYLSQAINHRYHQTFTQLVNSCRAKEAIRILSDTSDERPLKTVCAELGFRSMTTFYAVFKEATGITPSAYRDAAMRNAEEAGQS